MDVVLMEDDLDYHDYDCDCGFCNRHGRSYGVGVYRVIHQFADYCPEHDTDGGIGCRDNEVLERVYASSTRLAYFEARWLCQDKDWTVVP